MPKHPEMSSPSSSLKFSTIPLRLSPDRRFRKRRLKFLMSFISEEQRASTTLSSIYLQQDKSSFTKPFNSVRLIVSDSFERYCPFLMQKSCIVFCERWQILASDVFDMKLYLELMAWVLILNVQNRRPFVCLMRVPSSFVLNRLSATFACNTMFQLKNLTWLRKSFFTMSPSTLTWARLEPLSKITCISFEVKLELSMLLRVEEQEQNMRRWRCLQGRHTLGNTLEDSSTVRYLKIISNTEQSRPLLKLKKELVMS